MADSVCNICNKYIQPARFKAHIDLHQRDAANAQLNPRRRINIRVCGPAVPAGSLQNQAYFTTTQAAAAPLPINIPHEIHHEPYAGPLESECSICLDSRRNAAVFPCGHTQFCLPCVSGYIGKACPVCTRIIEKICHVFI